MAEKLLDRQEVANIARESGEARKEQIKENIQEKKEQIRDVIQSRTKSIIKAADDVSTLILGAPEAIGAQVEQVGKISKEKLDSAKEFVKGALKATAETWTNFFEKVNNKVSSTREKMRERREEAVAGAIKTGKKVAAVGLTPLVWGEKAISNVYKIPEEFERLGVDIGEARKDMSEYFSDLDEAFTKGVRGLLDKVNERLDEKSQKRLEALQSAREVAEEDAQAHREKADAWRERRDNFNRVQSLRAELQESES